MEDQEKLVSEFLAEQRKAAREMIKEMRHHPCEVCDGYGFLDVEIINSCLRKCPRCNGE